MSAFEKEERWNVLLTYVEAFWIDPPVNIQKTAYLNTAVDFFFLLTRTNFSQPVLTAHSQKSVCTQAQLVAFFKKNK